MLKVNDAQIELMQQIKNFELKDAEEKKLVDLIQHMVIKSNQYQIMKDLQ